MAKNTQNAVRTLAAVRQQLDGLYTRIEVCAFLPRQLEWIADNRYLLERECATLKIDLHTLSGEIRWEIVYDTARRVTAAAHRSAAELDKDGLTRLLREEARSLRESELGVLPPALRLSVLTFLCQHMPRLIESATLAASGRRRSDTALADTMGFCIRALRTLADTDFDAVRTAISTVEAQLRRDPSGDYAKMDAQSRARYRAQTAYLAARYHIGEAQCAQQAVMLAEKQTNVRQRHVGYYLFEEPLGRRPHFFAAKLHALLQGIVPTVLTLLLVLAGGGWWALGAHPILLDITIRIINPIFLRKLPLKALFSMEPQTKFSADTRTLCVIAALATDVGQVQTLCRRLEDYALAAKGGENLLFGLLLDLKEAANPVTDADAEILSAAQAQIAALDEKYGGFYLFTRPRTWSDSERTYIPRERKRGAIEALCALLRGGDSELTPSHPLPDGVRYLATLDADTEPAIDALARAVAALRHPLNRPVVQNGRVQAGHGLVQPRISHALANESDFSAAYSGYGGFDIYGAAAPDLHQNLYGETNYTGKGVIDIDAYLAVLHGRFPQERVLSHDLLEGAYLRAGYCPQAEFFEDFPTSPTAYFAREHRWIRGDWQTLPWMLRRKENPLSGSAKLRIGDNLRRSLRAFFDLLLIFFPLCTSAPDWLTLIVFFRFAADLLHSPILPHEVYHARIPTALMQTLRRTAYEFIFLPKLALTGLDAALRALWRMLVSRRHLLQWRTSGQVGTGKNTILSNFLCFWPCIAAGIGLLLPPYRSYFSTLCRVLIALAWLSAPFAAYYGAKLHTCKTSALDTAQRAWVQEQAARMYGYFRDTVTAETCFLPPDNVQFKPARGLARRTSPTNIGLAMLAFLTARDLGLDQTDSILTKLENMTKTLESMEKWHGNLYNWYSTDTAAPLYPRRVSTVDSGNLLGCLIAAEAALREDPSPRTQALASRIATLAASMKLAPLYDPVRKLMRIGFDAEHGRPDTGHYDLLASEVRLASYIAVARGEADPEHWKKLGRTLGSFGCRRGLLSWSGTMFEYLMPRLLMPSFAGGLLDESERFAVYCQKKRFRSYPYGISESCFFAFDSEMNFQYKAHGVQALGMGRGLDRETVLAPYAAWLTMLVDEQEAYKNLQAFAALDATGAWGFYEALDFTRSRIPEGSEYMPIRCFMAHHVGMSLLAAANALTDQRWQQRFMTLPLMRAHRILLKERVPVGAQPTLRRNFDAPAPRIPVGEAVIAETTGINWTHPEGIVLSNGGIRVFATQLGVERIVSAGEELIARDDRHLSANGGIRFFWASDGKLTALTPSPIFDEKTNHSARFTPSFVEYSTENDDFSAKLRVSVCAEEKAVQFALTLSGTSEGYLIAAFTPALDTHTAFSGHPAFSKLFLSAVVQPSPHALILSRRTRMGGDGTSAALLCSQAAIFSNSRERALGRLGFSGLLRIPAADAVGTGAPDPYAAAYVPLTLTQTPTQVNFALGCAPTADGAVRAAQGALHYGAGVESHRMYELMEALGMNPTQVRTAFSLYLRAFYRTDAHKKQADALENLHEGRSFLWRYGISGDEPLLLLRTGSETAAEEALRAHMFLYLAGAYCDIAVFGSFDGYHRGGYHAYIDILREWGGETMLGQRAGVHLLDVDAMSEDDRAQLAALADYVLDDGMPTAQEPAETPPIVRRALLSGTDGHSETACRIEDGTAEFTAESALAWSHPLANDRFGYLAADAGTGNLWYENSRENRINRWENDPLARTGPEDLDIVTPHGRQSLFARGNICQVRYTPGFAQWDTTFDGVSCTLRAFVHPTVAARVFEITLSGNSAAEASIEWHTTLTLGENDAARHYVRTQIDTDFGMLTAQNPSAVRFAPYRFAAASYPHAQAFTCDETDWLCGGFDARIGAGFLPCMAMHLVPQRDGEVYRAWIVCGCAAQTESLASIAGLCRPDGARQAAAETAEYWQRLCGDLTIETGDVRIDRYINGFAPYQVIAGRLFARTSMYQSSGAYGFRDQLQDAASLLFLPPNRMRYMLVREQLLRAAAHQYREGDVQHWWHPDGFAKYERGVRTRVTDDLLFLPYVTLLYAQKTGDSTIFTEKTPWLESVPLTDGEKERLEDAQVSQDQDDVWTHCCRVLDCVMMRGVGVHGLAKMGGGDWNDAMNEVGIEGRGESVWLSWFAALVFLQMAAEGERRTSADRVFAWRSFANDLIDAAYAAWDGDHFLRGWYDDGTPLGSSQRDACRIDAIAQAFSAFVPTGGVSKAQTGEREVRRTQALRTALRELYDGRIVRLFDPPFSTDSRQNPGYIKGYTPGVRENGGQYTHGAVWLAMGLLHTGFADDGAQVLGALAPSDRRGYRAEPFYIAADVYSSPELYGRAGWTIYTGAAGWYLRAVIDALLGLHFLPGRLEITPRLPGTWAGYRARYSCGGVEVSIRVRRGKTPQLLLDGTPCDAVSWPPQKGTHEIDVIVK